MKDKIIELIVIIGEGFNELVFDFQVNDVTFNSIEWLPDEDMILLHIFQNDDIDMHCNFDNIDIDKQIKVYKLLSSFID